MKIGIITFHQALNFGAVLQMYALQKYIKDNFPGPLVETVDYRCPYLEELYSIRSKKAKNPIKSLLKKVNFVLKKRRFDRFVSDYVSVSGTKYTPENISKVGETYDALIVGSDQVWNPVLTKGDMNYLLRFAPKNKRYSYAASFGVKNIPDDFKDEYRNNLGGFSAVSVREQAGAATIKELGIEKNVMTHVDPTFLLPIKEWQPLCTKKASSKKPYVLVYTVEFSKETIDAASSFAAENGMDVLYVGQHSKNLSVKYIPCPGIDRLLGLFRDAEYTFVNSFHGTAFSILFHKQFFSKLEFSDGRNDRIISILSICNLSGRTELSNIKQSIDWGGVDAALQSERKKSHKYLSGILKNEN